MGKWRNPVDGVSAVDIAKFDGALLFGFILFMFVVALFVTSAACASDDKTIDTCGETASIFANCLVDDLPSFEDDVDVNVTRGRCCS